MIIQSTIRKGYKKTEVGVIPNEWEVISLGDVFDFKNGLNKEKQYFGKGTPIVNYMDVYKKTGLTSKDLYGKVTLSSQEIKNYEVKKGDVFFTRTSETVDEIGISSVMIEDVKDTVFSGFVLRARPKNSKLEIGFKKYCFSTQEVRKEITSKSSYTTRALTNGRLLSGVRMAIPKSIAEQTLIATALSDADALISSLEKLIEKKRAIKQGAMQQLLKPKEGWVVKKLGEVAESASGGTPLTSHSSYYNGNIPWVVIADITIAGKYISDTEKKITEEGLINSSAKLFKKGTLLFAMYASIGKCTITTMDATCNQAILGIQTKTIYSEYLYYFLSFNELRFLRIGQTGTQSNLSKEIVENLDILYPSSDEQINIATILSDMDSEISILETKLEKYKNMKLGMMQNLLTGKIRLV